MVKVLFDHNMPPALARGLHQIVSISGHSALALRDKFPVNISDIDYFNVLGREGNWIVVSKDLQNAKKKAEKAAILRNRIVAFYFSPSLQKKNLEKQAAAILWHWEGMLQQNSLVERGLFQLPENKGKFRQL